MCPTLCDPIDGSPPGSPVPGILQARTLAAAAAKSLQSCPTLCDPRDGSPPGSPIPGILQARTLQVGCHFLLQCTKVKSESEVAQSCPTLSDPVDCSVPGSSVPGIFQARVLEWGALASSVKGVEVPSKAPFLALILSAFFFYLGLRRHWRTVQAGVQAHREPVSDSFLSSQNDSLSGSIICTQQFLSVSLIPQDRHWDTSLSYKQPLR